MSNWIKIVARHHEIIILDEDKIKLEYIGIDKDRRPLDHIITACEGYYLIEEYYHDTGEFITSWEEEDSIKDYLGY